MRYTLLLHYPEPTADELGPEALAEGMRAFQAYAKALDDAGVLASAEVLQQSNATTTVTLACGELVVQDGPFADTKEQLGGTFVIDVPDLDAAIEWARRAPSVSWGHVEIRPTATRLRGRLVAGRYSRSSDRPRLPHGRGACRAGVVRPARGVARGFDTGHRARRGRPCRRLRAGAAHLADDRQSPTTRRDGS